MTAVLALEDVACIRDGRLLFDALDLRLGAGDAASVVGPNGVLPPAAGRVMTGGAVTLADELLALDENLPLARALLFWARLDGGGREAVERGLATMGLVPLAEVPVRLLSTGQRRRASLARVVASGAIVWLLDEPGNGLDIGALELLAEAIRVHRGGGGVVLAASHQPIGLDDAHEVRL
jgi:heme exporter protein A